MWVSKLQLCQLKQRTFINKEQSERKSSQELEMIAKLSSKVMNGF